MWLLIYILSIGILAGCRKFVHAPVPATSLTGQTVYNSNATAAGAVSGLYLTMEGNSIGGGTHGIPALLGLSSDEFQLFPGTSDALLVQVYTNEQISTAGALPLQWSNIYNCIYQANSAIDGISSAPGVTASMKAQLIGESEVVRAFCYFYLINMYGGVPLITTTNYKVNEALGRSSVVEVYASIVSDLVDAQTRLGSDYLTPSGSVTPERVRPNSEVATALLARVYLFEGKWDSAELESSIVIGNSNYALVGQLDSAFVASNSEAIWQLEVPNNGYDAPDGIFQIGVQYYGGPSPAAPFLLSDSLMAAFEPGDLRRQFWIDSLPNGNGWYYLPYKYPLYHTNSPAVYYPTLLRLSEQYLIRAEARAQQGGGKLTGAASDLNIVRARAGLLPTTAATQGDLIGAVLRERRVELFTEYGHRWLDLIRSGMVSSVMASAVNWKGGTWTPTDTLYPIPASEIFADPNLVQNPGYN